MLGTYELCRLAQEAYRERVRKSEWKEVEGMTVWVPTLRERIVLALLTALARRAHAVRQPSTPWMPGGVMAK